MREKVEIGSTFQRLPDKIRGHPARGYDLAVRVDDHHPVEMIRDDASEHLANDFALSGGQSILTAPHPKLGDQRRQHEPRQGRLQCGRRRAQDKDLLKLQRQAFDGHRGDRRQGEGNELD